MGVQDVRKEGAAAVLLLQAAAQRGGRPGATVRMPIGTQTFDWEIELAAVIGKTRAQCHRRDALAACRRLHRRHRLLGARPNRAPETFYKLDWVAGKAHDTCCPLGPADGAGGAIADPQNLGLQLSVNGEVKQDGTHLRDDLRHRRADRHPSEIMTLDPGDVLLTGTPAGVGVPKGTFLKLGDRVDAELARYRYAVGWRASLKSNDRRG